MSEDDLLQKIAEQRHIIQQYEAALDEADEDRRHKQREIDRLRKIIDGLPVELVPKETQVISISQLVAEEDGECPF